MTSLIVDASVAVKWHVLQPGSDAARLIGKDYEIFAPELILAEIANALWKYVRVGELSAEIAGEMIAKSPQPFAALFPIQPLQAHAFQIGCRLKHPIYDCFYLALAQREGAPLITADRRLAGAAKSLSGVAIQLLADK